MRWKWKSRESGSCEIAWWRKLPREAIQMPRDRKTRLRSGPERRKAAPVPGKTPRLSLISYDADRFCEHVSCSLEECLASCDEDGIRWINVDGLSDPALLETLMGRFGIHPLVMEDVTALEQRPKLEDYGKYLFAVLNMLSIEEETGRLLSEQVSIVLGDRFVLSVQEEVGDLFGPVRERLRTGKGRLRKMGADALAYSLLDAVVDGYFTILETIGDQVESLEEELVTNPTRQTLHALHGQKRELIFLRHSIWPLRELIGSLERGESPLLSEQLAPYLRDLYDHTIQVLETVESLRDTLSGLLDIYLSSISNRMNEIMKVLTVISTLFIPLTFIAGVYGMNYRYMPELQWRWGYPAVLAVMAGVAGLMLRYFHRKGWL
jgi:magnesium transporter